MRAFRAIAVGLVSFTLGFAPSALAQCTENFDGVTAPALPAGWTATTAIGCVNSLPWVTTTNLPSSAPNAAFANDPNCISDEHLDSPNFPISSAAAVLTFSNQFDMETGFDGGVLEVSINGGAFQDILAAGASFGGGAYNGTISVNFGSPIAGRQAWTGNSAGYITTTVNLPASANGQSWRFRFRRGTDSSVSDVGWWVDNLSLTGCTTGCTVTIACPADQLASAPPGSLSTAVSYPAPTVGGTCTGISTSCVPASGELFPVGTTTVSCTATATGGQPANCTFDVTVGNATIQEIPTASTLGLAALALLLAGAAFVALRRAG